MQTRVLTITLFCFIFCQLAVFGNDRMPVIASLSYDHPIGIETITDTICAGTCKEIGGVSYCETGTYNVVDEQGNSSQLNLLVLEKEVQFARNAVCLGNSYLGEVRTEPGTFEIVYDTKGVNGCDVTVVVDLTVNAPKSTDIEEAIGYGECREFGPNTLCQSGEYQLRYISAEGCDSTVRINLIVEELIIDTISQFICAGESFQQGDSSLTESGLYQIRDTNELGQAKMTIIDLKVGNEIGANLRETICEGESFLINGESLTESGSYYFVLQAANGCDSLVQLDLSVGSVKTVQIKDSIPAGESYIVGRNNISFQGNYEFVYQSSEGCDSIVFLELSYIGSRDTTSNSGSEDGNEMEQDDGTGEGDNESTPCVNNKTIQESICFEERPFQFDNNTFWEGGLFDLQHRDNSGCVGSFTLQLSIETSRTRHLKTRICEGDTLRVGQNTYFTATTDSVLLQAASGCDSLVVLELAVAPRKYTIIERQICAGDPFTVNGHFISASGQYEELLRTSEGCDSLVIINLTVDTPIVIQERVELCAGSCYSDDLGNKACISGTYNFRFQSLNGCDSVVTIDLIIPDTARSAIRDTFCEGDIYPIGIFAVRRPGQYRERLLSSKGCDSILHYNLVQLDCEISAEKSPDTVICGGNTGDFSFSLIGGQAPFTYRWTSDDQRISGQGELELNEEVLENGLPGGVYSITVTDRLGTEAILEIEIIRPDIITSEFLMPDINGLNLACAKDANAFLEVVPTGGLPPYRYLWNNGGTRKRINNLTSGDYTVTITDRFNCPHIASQALKEPPQLFMIAEATDPECENLSSGSISIKEMRGGTPPYQYRLLDQEYADTPEFTNLDGGKYRVFVRDANNCAMDSSISIVTPDIIAVDYEQVVTIKLGDATPLEIFPSHPVKTIEWEGPPGLSCYDCLAPILNPPNTAEYLATLTSKDDCVTTTTLKVRVDKDRDVFVPNAFSPNTDGINDRFTIFAGPEVATVNFFRIYSRWGELLFEQSNFQPNDPQMGWDGYYEGQKLRQGVYIWIAQLTFIDDVVEEYSGDVLISE